MAELALPDIDQLYNKSVILYKGRPCKVLGVDRGPVATILNLVTARKHVVPFIKDDFKPTVGRIGFINHGGYAFYAMRSPMRRFSIGLTTANTSIRCLDDQRHDAYRAYDQVLSMNTKGWGAALMNDYPTFKDATRIAKETNGSCAFDKQFAIDANRNIYFKQKRVGSLPARASTCRRIQFDPEYQFLEILVEPHYEKTVRTFEPA